MIEILKVFICEESLFFLNKVSIVIYVFSAEVMLERTRRHQTFSVKPQHRPYIIPPARPHSPTPSTSSSTAQPQSFAPSTHTDAKHPHNHAAPSPASSAAPSADDQQDYNDDDEDMTNAGTPSSGYSSSTPPIIDLTSDDEDDDDDRDMTELEWQEIEYLVDNCLHEYNC